jgi:hypothetical protein
MHTPVLSACNNILNAIAVSSKDHNRDKNYTISGETITIRKRGDETLRAVSIRRQGSASAALRGVKSRDVA